MKKKLSITRRDFINGVSYGLAASVAPIDFLKAKNINPFKYFFTTYNYAIFLFNYFDTHSIQ